MLEEQLGGRAVVAVKPRCQALDLYADQPPRAAALRYTGSGAPQVVAAGSGHVAEAILASARERACPCTRIPISPTRSPRATRCPRRCGRRWRAVLAWAYELDEKAIRTKG